MTDLTIAIATPEQAQALVPALAEILIDCVEGEASIGFMLPLAREEAEAFWRGVATRVAEGSTLLHVAYLDGQPVGTVLLSPENRANQPHRADVQKLMVHRRGRNLGIAGALMAALEESARAEGRIVLCLDTATGSSAERLYQNLGWQKAGVIPRYALWPQGGYCDTTLFWKDLDR
ncbi:GCN5 family acetyltransferase [Labrys sp. WJW]|jgi:GNAT superfamily N-acetyltransferase|uniref:GNAT family N-acetyltransferase n=1 Tax=Labrys sp. WJW TaxID=1737983 RepID=UPI00082E196C|nr:GNAT family N-acetyltransferase [Labrys sp. WJW]OCC06105.1 GCN5 family acetyltransferase [Labrys sp. WJW]